MSPLSQLAFKGKKKIRVFGTPESPLFVAEDICAVLEIRHPAHAMRSLPATCKGGGVLLHTLGGKQEVSTLTEGGVYRMIFKSRKPQAEEFMTWITEEVLPAIRLTGTYNLKEQARELAFKHFLTEIPMEYRRTFSDSWFIAILGVWGLEYVKARTPSFIGKIINEYVFDALIAGLPAELKARRAECGDNSAKLHQFIKENAREKLSEQLAVTKSIALNSQNNPDFFRECFARTFRGQDQLLLFVSKKKAKALSQN